jgi:hypothetical protein
VPECRPSGVLFSGEHEQACALLPAAKLTTEAPRFRIVMVVLL